MRELSLFTGAGGGIYGSKLLGWKTVGYVEWEDYPQRVIAQRIEDGVFDRAPIFGDVRTFVSEGYARRYRGMVDVVTGGFPCQPFSVAGKRKASDDERNMWPATLDVIKAVKPRIVFLENVPGLLSATVDDESGRPIHYFGAILQDLAEAGYDAKWCVLGAGDVGAPHVRKRLWILAERRESFSDTERSYARRKADQRIATESGENGKWISQRWDDVANTKSKSSNGCATNKKHSQQGILQFGDCCGEKTISYSYGSGPQKSWWSFDPSDSVENEEGEVDRAFYDSQWGIESPLGRVANGVANRINRLKGIGNGQVPITMAAAYEILSKTDSGVW